MWTSMSRWVCPEATVGGCILRLLLMGVGGRVLRLLLVGVS